jgi:hypothetical protein
MPYRPLLALGLVVAGVATSVGCTDSGKVSETKAVEHVDRLSKLAADDVDQLRRGMPRGAKALGQLWSVEGDKTPEPAVVRTRMESVRNGDADLEVAKSTFFAVTDDKGVVLRSDQDPDAIAGKTLIPSFPALAKALSGEGVETYGAMPELQGSRNGIDEQWVTAAPLRDDQGKVRGMYASGWSMRRFAYHLEEALHSELRSGAKNAPGKMPLVYVFVFHDKKVYGAPVTPEVDVEALEKLDLAAHATDAAVFHQQLEITGRTYGVAARRVPKLGADAGVAVLRSEI